jgi:hypothetical protein
MFACRPTKIALTLVVSASSARIAFIRLRPSIQKLGDSSRASANAGIEVKEGINTTWTSFICPTSAKNLSKYGFTSLCVRFIFQLAATIFFFTIG